MILYIFNNNLCVCISSSSFCFLVFPCPYSLSFFYSSPISYYFPIVLFVITMFIFLKTISGYFYILILVLTISLFLICSLLFPHNYYVSLFFPYSYSYFLYINMFSQSPFIYLLLFPYSYFSSSYPYILISYQSISIFMS